MLNLKLSQIISNEAVAFQKRSSLAQSIIVAVKDLQAAADDLNIKKAHERAKHIVAPAFKTHLIKFSKIMSQIVEKHIGLPLELSYEESRNLGIAIYYKNTPFSGVVQGFSHSNTPLINKTYVQWLKQNGTSIKSALTALSTSSLSLDLEKCKIEKTDGFSARMFVDPLFLCCADSFIPNNQDDRKMNLTPEEVTYVICHELGHMFFVFENWMSSVIQGRYVESQVAQIQHYNNQEIEDYISQAIKYLSNTTDTRVMSIVGPLELVRKEVKESKVPMGNKVAPLINDTLNTIINSTLLFETMNMGTYSRVKSLSQGASDSYFHRNIWARCEHYADQFAARQNLHDAAFSSIEKFEILHISSPGLFKTVLFDLFTKIYRVNTISIYDQPVDRAKAIMDDLALLLKQHNFKFTKKELKLYIEQYAKMQDKIKHYQETLYRPKESILVRLAKYLDLIKDVNDLKLDRDYEALLTRLNKIHTSDLGVHAIRLDVLSK